MSGRISPTQARFAEAGMGTGMYESWYTRLVSPDEPLAVWIRYTIDKAPGREATGTVWFTLFDETADRPFARRKEGQVVATPPVSWVEIGGSRIGSEGLRGECFEAGWDLSFTARSPAFFHLPWSRLYGFPLPKTNPISPIPDGEFSGEIRVGDERIELDGWRGMIGHNWGAEHAARWIWLHGSCFDEDPDAWIDIAMGRIRMAGKLLPWVANGAVHLDGSTRRVGGLFARGVEVNEDPRHLDARLPAGGASLALEIESPENLTVGWRYGDPADPGAHAHEVVNCSAARMTASVDLSGEPEAVTLSTRHGAVYELGMTETDHGIPIESGFPAGETAGRDH